MTIQPTVVRGLSDDLNLGSAFFHRLGLEKPTVIKFSGGKTTLEVGHDGKAEMIQRMDLYCANPIWGDRGEILSDLQWSGPRIRSSQQKIALRC